MQDHLTCTGLVVWYGINTGQTANGHVFVQPAMMSGSVTATPGTNTDTIAGFADSANGASLASSLRLATAQPPSGLSLVPVWSPSAGTINLRLINSTWAVVIEINNTALTHGHRSPRL